MIRSVIGALVGHEIDRRDNAGGLSGAVLGVIAARVLSRSGPLGLALGAAYVAKKAVDRRRATRRA